MITTKKEMNDFIESIIRGIESGELYAERNSYGSWYVMNTYDFMNEFGHMTYEDDCDMYPLQDSCCNPGSCSIYEQCKTRIVEEIRRKQDESF